MTQLAPSARGGICRHVADLCRRLDAVERPCRLLAPAETIERVSDFGLPGAVEKVFIPRLKLDPGLVFGSAIAVRTVYPRGSILHAHGYKAAIAAAMAGAQPLVMTAHNLPDRRGFAPVRFALSRAAVVIAVSDTVGEALRLRGVPPHKIRVISNGIDLPPLPVREQRETARADIFELVRRSGGSAAPDVSTSSPVVLGVGRLSFEKGFDVLLNAFQTICETGSDGVLVIVGDGPERPMLTEAIPPGLKSRVFFVGELPDSRRVFAGADVVVIPSRVEGQSIVALEALSMGVRVVASDIGGLPSMVQPGLTGWLAAPGDPLDLARGISAALGEAPDVYAATGRQLLEQKFNADVSFGHVLKAYEDALRDEGDRR